MTHSPGPWRLKRATYVVDRIKEYYWVGFGTIGDVSILSDNPQVIGQGVAVVGGYPTNIVPVKYYGYLTE